MAADAIVAQPGTITGSIGVISGQARAGPGAGPGRGEHGLGDRGRARGHVHRVPAVQRGRMGQDQQLAGPHLRRLHRQGGGRARADPGRRCTRWPGAGCGPARTPPASAWWTSWAGWTPRWRVARDKAALPDVAPVRLYPRCHPLDRLRPPDSSEAARPPRRPRPVRRGLGPGRWRLGRPAAGLPAVRTAAAARTAGTDPSDRTGCLSPGRPVTADSGPGWPTALSRLRHRRHAGHRGRRPGRRRHHGQRVLPGVPGPAAGPGLADGRVLPGGTARPGGPVRGHDAGRRASGPWRAGSPRPGGPGRG